MSKVLFCTTIGLIASGFLFSMTYIWLNARGKATELGARNASMLKIAKASMLLSIVFALLSCLLANAGTVDAAIHRTKILYSAIAVSWLAVIAACGAAMLVALISKASFRKNLFEALKKLFTIAIWGSILGVLLAWLLG